jgi:hypothetical protein
MCPDALNPATQTQRGVADRSAQGLRRRGPSCFIGEVVDRNAEPDPLGWSLLDASAASVLVNRLLLYDGVTRPRPAASAAGNGEPGRSGRARLLPGSLLAHLRAFPGPG